jgi:hypothetical protein
LIEAGKRGQTILLSMDQTNLSNWMALLMISLRVGDCALPLVWLAETGAANIGFDGQKHLLEQVLVWIPAGVPVLLSADRFYPSIDLFEWLRRQNWQYRIHLKSNILADPGYGDEAPLGNGRRT